MLGNKCKSSYSGKRIFIYQPIIGISGNNFGALTLTNCDVTVFPKYLYNDDWAGYIPAFTDPYTLLGAPGQHVPARVPFGAYLSSIYCAAIMATNTNFHTNDCGFMWHGITNFVRPNPDILDPPIAVPKVVFNNCTVVDSYLGVGPTLGNSEIDVYTNISNSTFQRNYLSLTTKGLSIINNTKFKGPELVPGKTLIPMQKWTINCPYTGNNACNGLSPWVGIYQASGELYFQANSSIDHHLFGIYKTQSGNQFGTGLTSVDNSSLTNNLLAGILSDNYPVGGVSVTNDSHIQIPELGGTTSPQMDYNIAHLPVGGLFGVGINGYNTTIPITIDHSSIAGVPEQFLNPALFHEGVIWKGGLTATYSAFNYAYDGVLLLGGGNNSISNCTFNTMARNAISVQTTTVPDIHANTFTNNPTGIYVEASVPSGPAQLILKASCNVFNMGSQSTATGILANVLPVSGTTSAGTGLIAGGDKSLGEYPGGANVFPVVDRNIPKLPCFNINNGYDIECMWAGVLGWQTLNLQNGSSGSVEYHRYDNEYAGIPLSFATKAVLTNSTCYPLRY